MKKKAEALQAQIDKERATIRTDEYPISIGELSNMYRDGELNIHPEFQRYFRWDDDRKSRFVESLLLGIPIPSIFVAQQANGVWDVIDGLQRLSTIFQLMGILRDEDNKKVAPLSLSATQYLPAMDGVAWEAHTEGMGFSAAQKLFIKRAKLDVKIILRESSEKAKFELFQRLNTGGTQLSEQEIRNASLVAANKPFFDWMRELASFVPFIDSTAISDRVLDEQFDMELVLRFLVFRNFPSAMHKSIGDLGQFLSNQMMTMSERFNIFKSAEKDAFEKTFSHIYAEMGTDAFRKYDAAKDRFIGGFSISAFEILAMGVGYNVNNIDHLDKVKMLKGIKEVWKDPKFISSTGSGIRASSRIPVTLQLGREAFRK